MGKWRGLEEKKALEEDKEKETGKKCLLSKSQILEHQKKSMMGHLSYDILVFGAYYE